MNQISSRFSKLSALCLLPLCSLASYSNDSVDYYAQRAYEAELIELQDKSELCQMLSDRGCSLLEYVFTPDVDKKQLDFSDKKLLGEVMNITPEAAADVRYIDGDDLRRKVVRNSAISLGVSIAVAYESNRYNKLWESYSDFYDRVMRFDVLMMGSDAGQIIVPAIISQVDNYSATIEQGRTFRAAGKVYRIVEQPYFDYQPPSWRSYLNLSFDSPKIPPPSVLPKNKVEVEIFRTYLVKGFVAGVDVVEQRAEVAYEKMVGDFNGMALYHVLLDYEMVSMPVIETNYSAVAINGKGDEMSLDDTIMRISVHPRLDGDRNKWRALSALKDMDLNIMGSEFLEGYYSE